MAEAGQSHEMRERFAREALLLAGVDSRHVSKILGFGFDKGQPFLVLERLHGETLDAKLRRDGPVPPPLAARWVEQLIVGVRDCHDAKVIHRDIKPSNIFLHHDGFEETVKLIDFGVARLREITGDDGGLTSTSHVIGSMGYMAPEQFKNAKSVGYPADLYAVGVVIFRTFTGRLPFVSRSLEAVIRMKTEQVVPRISSMPGMVQNPLLDWFVQKAMVRDPAQRFQSAREMLEQWWTVMASFDGDGATDGCTGIGRVDESYAGPRPMQARAVPPSSSLSHPRHPSRRRAGARTAPPPSPLGHSADHDGPYNPTTASSIDNGDLAARCPPSTRCATCGGRRCPQSRTSGPPRFHRRHRSHRTPVSRAPAATRARTQTTPGGDISDVDPFDLPTRNDPNLRKLVERELELQRARRRERG